MADAPIVADDTVTEEAPVTFNIKSSSDAKYVMTLPLSMTVLELKNKIAGADYADIPPERQRLIYSGRVLKDPDTLASYKIKEGNTVHLVKGAASNQRQNPANTSASAANAGTTSASSGVPTNIAAGTGNNPLAGLTGARYAGFAQLPGAGMFGPDGGMGPPPDVEQLMENPQFASTMNEVLQNPHVIDQMIQSNPLLRGLGPQVREAIQDPNFRRMLTNPALMRQMSQMSRRVNAGSGFGGLGGRAGGEAFPAPGVTDTTPAREGEGSATPGAGPTAPANPLGLFGGAGAAENLAAFLQAGGFGIPQLNVPANPAGSTPGGQDATATGGGQAGATNDNNNNPFAQIAQNPLLQNPALMQQMLNAFGGEGGNPAGTGGGVGGDGGGGGAGAGAGTGAGAGQAFNPLAAIFSPEGLAAMQQQQQQAAAQPAAPADTRPPEERYEEQLRQLNEMGFYEFERNIEALRRAGGSVQGAVEYLLQ